MKTTKTSWRNLLWLAAGALLAGCSYQSTSYTRSSSSPLLKLALNAGATGGTWRTQGDITRSDRHGSWVNIRVEDPAASSVFGFGLHRDNLKFNFHSPSAETSGQFRGSIEREAGTFSFVGEGVASDASGTFHFEVNPAYVEQVQALLSQVPSGREWLLLALHDVSVAFLREVKNAGHTVMAGDILRLRQNGVALDYLVALHQGGCAYSIDDIIKLRRAGVTAEYPVGMKKAGYSLPVTEIVSLRNSGVPLEYFLDLKQADRRLSAEQIIKVRQAGISTDFFRETREILPSLSESEIIKLRHAGISSDYLRQWKNFDVSWEDVIKLRHAGVPSDYAGALKEAGYELTPDQIIKLRHAGIAADFFRATKKAGYDFSCDDLIKLRHAGVTAEYLESIHSPGQRNLPADVIADLRRRGVPVETVKQIRSHSN